MRCVGSVLIEAIMDPVGEVRYTVGEVRYTVSQEPEECEWPFTFAQALDRVGVLLHRITQRARQRSEFALPGWDLT